MPSRRAVITTALYTLLISSLYVHLTTAFTSYARFLALYLAAVAVLAYQIMFCDLSRWRLGVNCGLLLGALGLTNIAYAGWRNFFGLDIYLELAAIQHILVDGAWDPGVLAPSSTYRPYPAVHLSTITIHYFLGVPLAAIARWGPLALLGLIAVAVGLVLRRLTSSTTAGYAALLFGLQTAAIVDNVYLGRFYFSLPVYFVTLYAVLRLVRSARRDRVWFVLALVGLAALAISHPFTRTVALLSLLAIVAVASTVDIKPRIAGQQRLRNASAVPTLAVLLFAFIMIHTTYGYFRSSSFLLKGLQVASLFAEQYLTSSPAASGGGGAAASPGVGAEMPLHRQIWAYGQFALLLGVYGLLGLSNREWLSVENLAVIVLSILLLALNAPIYLFSLIAIFRFTVFLWPLLAGPLLEGLTRHSQTLRSVGVVVVLLMAGLQMGGHAPHELDRSVEPAGYDRMVEPETRVTIQTLPLRGTIAGNSYLDRAALPQPHVSAVANRGAFAAAASGSLEYKYLAVSTRDRRSIYIYAPSSLTPRAVSPTLSRLYQTRPELHQIYSNGHNTVYSDGRSG